MISILKKLFLAVILAGISVAANADNTGMYIYGDIGQALETLPQGQINSVFTSMGVTNIVSTTNSNPFAYKLQVGYQFNQFWAIEAGYTAVNDLRYSGTGNYGSIPGSATGAENSNIWDLVAAGTLPFGAGFSGTGRLGVSSVHMADTGTLFYPGGTATASIDGSKAAYTYGIGLKYDINTKFSLRADVDNYNSPVASGIARFDVWALGIGYNF